MDIYFFNYGELYRGMPESSLRFVDPDGSSIEAASQLSINTQTLYLPYNTYTATFSGPYAGPLVEYIKLQSFLFG